MWFTSSSFWSFGIFLISNSNFSAALWVFVLCCQISFIGLLALVYFAQVLELLWSNILFSKLFEMPVYSELSEHLTMYTYRIVVVQYIKSFFKRTPCVGSPFVFYGVILCISLGNNSASFTFSNHMIFCTNLAIQKPNHHSSGIPYLNASR